MNTAELTEAVEALQGQVTELQGQVTELQNIITKAPSEVGGGVDYGAAVNAIAAKIGHDMSQHIVAEKTDA